jgi:hypothetical protein
VGAQHDALTLAPSLVQQEARPGRRSVRARPGPRRSRRSHSPALEHHQQCDYDFGCHQFALTSSGGRRRQRRQRLGNGLNGRVRIALLGSAAKRLQVRRRYKGPVGVSRAEGSLGSGPNGACGRPVHDANRRRSGAFLRWRGRRVPFRRRQTGAFPTAGGLFRGGDQVLPVLGVRLRVGRVGRLSVCRRS